MAGRLVVRQTGGQAGDGEEGMTHSFAAWETFRFKGRKFLALADGGRNVFIIDEGMNTYGSWWSVESFKKHVVLDGLDALILERP